MIAVHTDMLVMGVGYTEQEAYLDAEAHGSEDETLLDVCAITEQAALYVASGGDCRGLRLVERDGEEVFELNSVFPIARLSL